MSEIKSGFRFSFIAAVMPLAALVLLAGLAQSEQWFWIFLAVMSHFILLLLISLPQKHAVSYYLNAKGGFWIAVGGTIALGALADIYQNMFLTMALLYCTWFFVVWLLFLPSQLSHWFACIAVFGFICSVFASHTPSKIAFELARPTLDAKSNNSNLETRLMFRFGPAASECVQSNTPKGASIKAMGTNTFFGIQNSGTTEQVWFGMNLATLKTSTSGR